MGGPDRPGWHDRGRAFFKTLLPEFARRRGEAEVPTLDEYMQRPGRRPEQKRAMYLCVDALVGILNSTYIKMREGCITLIAKSELLLKWYSPSANNRSIQFPHTAETLAAGPESAYLIEMMKLVFAPLGVDVVVGWTKEQMGALYSRNTEAAYVIAADGAKADACVTSECYAQLRALGAACRLGTSFSEAVTRYETSFVKANGATYAVSGTLASGTPITTCLQTLRHAVAAAHAVAALREAGVAARAIVYSDDVLLFPSLGSDREKVVDVLLRTARDVSVVLEVAERVSFCSAVFVRCTPHVVTLPDGDKYETHHHMVVSPARVLARSGYTFKGLPGKRDAARASREAMDLAREHSSSPLLRSYYLAVARAGASMAHAEEPDWVYRPPSIPPVDAIEFEDTCALFGFDADFLRRFDSAMDEVLAFPCVVNVPGFEIYAHDAATEAHASLDFLPYVRPEAPPAPREELAPDGDVLASAERHEVRADAAAGGEMPPPQVAEVPAARLLESRIELQPAAPGVLIGHEVKAAVTRASTFALKGLMVALLAFCIYSILFVPFAPAPSSVPPELSNLISLATNHTVKASFEYKGVMVTVSVAPHIAVRGNAKSGGSKHGKGKSSKASNELESLKAMIKAMRASRSKGGAPRGGGGVAKAAALDAASRTRVAVDADSDMSVGAHVSAGQLIARGKQTALAAANLYLAAALDPMNAPPGGKPQIAHGFPCATATFPSSQTFVSTLCGAKYRLCFEWGPGLINSFRIATLDASGNITAWADIADPFYSYATSYIQGWQAVGAGLELSSLVPLLDTAGEIVVLYQTAGEWPTGAWPAPSVRNSRYADVFSIADMRARGKFGSLWRPASPASAAEMVSPANRMLNGRVLVMCESTTPIELTARVIKHVVFSLVSAATVGVEVTTRNLSVERVTEVFDAVSAGVGNPGPPDILEKTAALVEKIVGSVTAVLPVAKRVMTGVSSIWGFAKGLLGDAHVHAVSGALAAQWYTERAYPPPRCLVSDDGPAVIRAVMANEGTLDSFDFDAWVTGRMDLDALSRVGHLHPELAAALLKARASLVGGEAPPRAPSRRYAPSSVGDDEAKYAHSDIEEDSDDYAAARVMVRDREWALRVVYEVGSAVVPRPLIAATGLGAGGR